MAAVWNNAPPMSIKNVAEFRLQKPCMLTMKKAHRLLKERLQRECMSW